MPAAGPAQVRGACTILSLDSTHIPSISTHPRHQLRSGERKRKPPSLLLRRTLAAPPPPHAADPQPSPLATAQGRVLLGKWQLGWDRPAPIKCKGLSVLGLLQATARRRSPGCSEPSLRPGRESVSLWAEVPALGVTPQLPHHQDTALTSSALLLSSRDCSEYQHLQVAPCPKVSVEQSLTLPLDRDSATAGCSARPVTETPEPRSGLHTLGWQARGYPGAGTGLSSPSNGRAEYFKRA